MYLPLLHGTLPDNLGAYAASACPLDVVSSAVLLSVRRHQSDLGYASPDLGLPNVTARTLVVRARRAPYCLQVHHWTSSGVPTAVISSLKLI